jgi:hypothetical protein
VGRGVQPVLSKKEKEQQRQKEELNSLAALHDHGLMQKPIVMEQKFALFEIVEEKPFRSGAAPNLSQTNNDDKNRLPPIRLLQREKTKTLLTAQDLEEKLERANQRKQVGLVKLNFSFIIEFLITRIEIIHK